MDLLFLGHCEATITIALLAAFFRVTRIAALSKPYGTELTRNIDQARDFPKPMASPNERTKLAVGLG